MIERLTVHPPDTLEVSGPVIFLAGPIQGASYWQSKATDLLHDIEPTIVVANPRKDYPEGTFIYEKQVDWETHYLRLAGRAGVVAFWLAKQTEETPGRAYAQTTRFELAEWKMHHEYDNAKITIGIEKGFGNARYIKHRFAQDCPDVKMVDNLEAMCRNAIDLCTDSPANSPEYS